MCHDGKELMKDGEIKTVWTAPSQGRELCYIVICTTLPSANAILFLPVFFSTITAISRETCTPGISHHSTDVDYIISIVVSVFKLAV